jgi:hypothetical protein
MNTGLTSFSDPANIGPMYPFAGLEVPMVIIGVILWIAFHVIAHRQETQEWHEADAAFDADLLLPGSDEPQRTTHP